MGKMHRIQTFGNAEISHLEVPEFIYKEIGRFEVPVDNTLFLTIHQCRTDVPANLQHFLL